MKIFFNTLAFLFCILTLGFVDVEIKYSDKTGFKWVGWTSRKDREDGADNDN